MHNAPTQLLYADAQCRLLRSAGCVFVQFEAPQNVVSFAPHGGGLRTARAAVIWQVCNADLPIGRDPLELLRVRMAGVHEAAVGMLTSRDVGAVEFARSECAGASARVVVTAGLSNAVRIGDSPGPLRAPGTINIVAQLDQPLTQLGLLEALSLVAEARTLAVLECGEPSRRSAAPATGTGTDCIAVFCPQGEGARPYCGKHTPLGHVLGAACLQATRRAVGRWQREQSPP